ncbi:hypothetical protein TSUD_359880 [Trifolium subterraneum]|uniref:Uncharacterized protein n=1 Tax=Trifolium subterraneum TaxID=3900 RepID=A0A2Z6MMQ7_TRISU|nr:hypothetical protein TSUD_359880 [Trifolium subterraneum]
MKLQEIKTSRNFPHIIVLIMELPHFPLPVEQFLLHQFQVHCQELPNSAALPPTS